MCVIKLSKYVCAHMRACVNVCRGVHLCLFVNVVLCVTAALSG